MRVADPQDPEKSAVRTASAFFDFSDSLTQTRRLRRYTFASLQKEDNI
jgi:hypothetical protein